MTFDVTDVKVSEGQKALASFIKKETGKAIKPETIAVIDALREAYRKDPARVAEREAVKAAARKRKEEAYRKAVEKAAALAKSLGIPGNFDVTPADIKAEESDGWEDEPGEGVEDFIEEDEAEAEPVPEVVVAVTPTSTKKAPAKKAKPLALVPPAEQTPNDEDTSAIVVAEQEDGWEAEPDAAAAAGDDFFDDGAEDY